MRCAPGQHSIEDGVTIPMADLHGPFDYHLTRKLCRLAEEQKIPYRARCVPLLPI